MEDHVDSKVGEIQDQTGRSSVDSNGAYPPMMWELLPECEDFYSLDQNSSDCVPYRSTKSELERVRQVSLITEDSLSWILWDVKLPVVNKTKIIL